jgi:2-hydroxy-6-oxonona-2,4-dienedioate hydrolase
MFVEVICLSFQNVRRVEVTTPAIAYPLEVAGHLTRIIEAGDGDNVVLFIHGLGARADRWRGTVERVGEKGYRAIAFDLPGHGFASKSGDGPTTVPEFSQYVLAVLMALNVERSTLVGTSLGGHVAAFVATQSPERVRGLVLVGALGLVPIGRETGLAIRNSVVAVDRERIAAKLSLVFANPNLVNNRLIEEEFRINNSPGAIDGFRRLGDYIATKVDEHCVGPELSVLLKPRDILLIWGAADRIVPVSVGVAARAALGDPELQLISNAGHAPYLEQADEFDALLFRFLSRDVKR